MFPFGFGVGDAAPEPPEGELQARYINPGSGDYEHNSATGLLKQMPPLRQRVLLKIRTIVGSSTVLPTLGIRLPRKIDRTFESTVRASVRAAFRQETDVERVMRIDEIGVELTTSSRAQITLTYTDLSTGDRESVTA